MKEKLAGYVKEQLKRGVDPQKLRNWLITQGHLKGKVDEAFDEAYKRHYELKVPKFAYAAAGILAVIAVVYGLMTYMSLPGETYTPGERTSSFSSKANCALLTAENPKNACYAKFAVLEKNYGLCRDDFCQGLKPAHELAETQETYDESEFLKIIETHYGVSLSLNFAPLHIPASPLKPLINVSVRAPLKQGLNSPPGYGNSF